MEPTYSHPAAMDPMQNLETPHGWYTYGYGTTIPSSYMPYTAFSSPAPSVYEVPSPSTPSSYFDAYTYTMGEARGSPNSAEKRGLDSPAQGSTHLPQTTTFPPHTYQTHQIVCPPPRTHNYLTPLARAQAEYQPQRPEDARVMQALEIAWESEEGANNETVAGILEAAITRIWGYIEAQPDSYILTRDEFSIFNYFQNRFIGNEVATAARKRFWDNYRQ